MTTDVETKLDTTKLDPNEVAAGLDAGATTEPASCPLMADTVQLLPIRYAYVENLDPFKEARKKPLPETTTNTNETSTKVTTENTESEQTYFGANLEEIVVYPRPHPIGYRLIRDGWLYIVEVATDSRIYEYVLKDGVVTQRTYKGGTMSNANRSTYEGIEQRTGKDKALVFKKDRVLYVAFSEVQWTNRKCNQVLKTEERKLLMQEIDLRGVNCEHQNDHLITKEIAEKYIAEVAEEYKAPSYDVEFKEEKTAYSWENKDISNFKKVPIGKLTAQVVPECQKGNYLFMVVNDYIGMMQDLAKEQDMVTDWLGDWSEKNDNSLKYNVGSYIDSTLTITANNATSKGASDWINELTPEQKEKLFDYVNYKIEFDRIEPFLWHYKYDETYDRFEKDGRTDKFYEMDAELSAKKKAMLASIGEKQYKEHEQEIEALEEAQIKYLHGTFWGTRGLNQLVDTVKLKKYLDIERPKYKRWQNRLGTITAARVKLFTEHFYMTTWYFDSDVDDQHKDVLLIEQSCTHNILRNDYSIDTIAKYFNEHPYYIFPAFQTNYTAEYYNKTRPKVAKWLRDTKKVLDAYTSGKGTDFQELEKIMDKAYWKKILEAPVSIQDIQKLRQLNYSQAIYNTLTDILDDLSNPRATAAAQKAITSNLQQLENTVNKLSLAQRASFLIDIKQHGYVEINESPMATKKAQAHIDVSLTILKNIQANKQKIAQYTKQRKQLYNPNSMESKGLSYKVRKDKIASLKATIAKLQTENTSYIKALDNRQAQLQTLVSPLQAGEVPFSLRFTVPAEQQKMLNYEKQILASKFYGNDAKGVYSAVKSTNVPIILLCLNVKNLITVWNKYEKDKELGEIVRGPLTASILGTISATLSVIQTFHTSLIKQAITQVEGISSKTAGAVLASKLSKVSLLLTGSAQIIGGIASYITLIATHQKWIEAIYDGDTAKAAAAISVLAGNYGNAGVSTVGTIHTAIAARGLYKDIKIAKMAVRTAWAVRGAKFATSIARLTPVGLGFTALQLIGEFAYNYYNLSDSQEWFERCYWGRKNKGWNQQQHNQKLAEALLKPSIADQGVVVDNGQHWRVLQLIIPGQLSQSLQDRPIEWEAMWFQNGMDYPHKDTQIGEYLWQHSKIISPAPLTIEWRLPWIDKADWSEIYHSNTLFIRLYHTPDMATEPLNSDKQAIAYRIPLRAWDKKNKEQTDFIKPEKGSKIPKIAEKVTYKGEING